MNMYPLLVISNGALTGIVFLSFKNSQLFGQNGSRYTSE